MTGNKIAVARGDSEVRANHNKHLLAIGRTKLGSAAMVERRRHILKIARRMIVEGGIEGLTIRGLASAAHVAPRTIYNAFQSKELVVGLTVQEYFEAFKQNVRFETKSDTLVGVLERQATVMLRNHAIPNYLQTIVALYFSYTISGRLRKILINIAVEPYLPWLETVAAQKQLVDGIGLDRLSTTLADLQYAMLHEAAFQKYDRFRLVSLICSVAFTHLRGATTGAAANQLKKQLETLSEPRYIARLVEEGEERIAHLDHE